jgi:hypothetical protein
MRLLRARQRRANDDGEGERGTHALYLAFALSRGQCSATKNEPDAHAQQKHDTHEDEKKNASHRDRVS